MPTCDLRVPNPIPVFRPAKPQFLPQPTQVAMPVLSHFPKPCWNLRESPLAPVSPRDQVDHRTSGQMAVVPHKPITPVPLEVLVRKLVPVIPALEAQPLAQPIHVAPPIGRRVPKPLGSPGEQPRLPIVLGEAISYRFDCRLTPILLQPAAVALTAEARFKFEPIEILHGAEAKSVPKPQQVVAAMFTVFPESRRHRARNPYRVDPPQVSGVANRRAIDRFLLPSHNLRPFGASGALVASRRATGQLKTILLRRGQFVISLHNPQPASSIPTTPSLASRPSCVSPCWPRHHSDRCDRLEFHVARG